MKTSIIAAAAAIALSPAIALAQGQTHIPVTKEGHETSSISAMDTSTVAGQTTDTSTVGGEVSLQGAQRGDTTQLGTGAVAPEPTHTLQGQAADSMQGQPADSMQMGAPEQSVTTTAPGNVSTGDTTAAPAATPYAGDTTTAATDTSTTTSDTSTTTAAAAAPTDTTGAAAGAPKAPEPPGAPVPQSAVSAQGDASLIGSPAWWSSHSTADGKTGGAAAPAPSNNNQPNSGYQNNQPTDTSSSGGEVSTPTSTDTTTAGQPGQVAPNPNAQPLRVSPVDSARIGVPETREMHHADSLAADSAAAAARDTTQPPR